MTDWHKVIAHFANDVETHFDHLKYKLHDRLIGVSPMKIIPYNGYGRPDKLCLKGRVLEDKGEQAARDNDNLWNNIVNMYRRMESDEVPFARLLACFDGIEQEFTADEEGYFDITIELEKPLPTDRIWHTIHLKLLSPISDRQPGPVEADGQVFVPQPSAQFAVISDIDDTIIQTDATHLIRMARNVFLGNSRTRLPFPGVSTFYRALLDGPHGNDLNPLFYVSSSPWNLYDLLVDFFHLQNIPLGPVLFLRDWGITDNEILPTRNRGHKLGVIQTLLDFYQDLPFILIGDSGQEDPEIYQEVAASYPERVLAVYIRNVSHDLKRPAAIQKLVEKVIAAHSTLILADDTVAIAKHAASQGWIAEQALHGITVEKEKDQEPLTPIEKLMGEEQKPEGPTIVVDKKTQADQANPAAAGSIQEAMDQSKEEGQKPPTVIVQPDSGSQEASEPQPKKKN